MERGRVWGDPDDCIVCHGGDPAGSTADAAHRGSVETVSGAEGPDGFYPDPASPWVNGKSCGQCHAELVRAQWNSLMMTETGKIQGTTWAFGSLEGYEHRWANYDGRNPANASERLGTPAYRDYMAKKAAAFPNVYVRRQETLPEAPSHAELDSLADDPRKAAFTYVRAECQRCHLGVKGRARRGDYRGMGCGACHVPYGNEGLYEGSDRTIPKDEPGHPLLHRIQATSDAVVEAGRVRYSGIPVETCTTRHNRGKRIGVSYQGLMEAAWDSPYTEGGGGQIALHTKHYLAMTEDVHYRKGMLCQDCHTSGDVHGDGFIAGSNLAAVEVECADCHGTPDRYSWELPLGFGDENGPGAAIGPPRETARSLPAHLERGAVAEAPGGWLLTARGNPMPEVVRSGDLVVVHTAAGKVLQIEPLKAKAARGALPPAARVAMENIGRHIEKMECHACHASWAPQCYGCHVKIDYSSGKRSFDWVAAGQRHATPAGRTAEGEADFQTTIPGEVTERRSYMRWEDPALGVNGEGRVTPIIPGCQVSVTIIGRDGEEIVRNHIFRTLPHSEGAGSEGQLGSDMSPVQPHTIGRARSCESCHGSEKAMGYGIGGGRLNRAWNRPAVVDLRTAVGEVIPQRARLQIEAIPGLQRDWSAVVTPEGVQLQTVGHHFPGSGPLSKGQRRVMDRRNVCLGCHQEIPAESLAVSLMHHAAASAGLLPVSRGEHERLLHSFLLIAAWTQIVGGALAALCVGLLLWRRKRSGSRELAGG